MITEKPVTYTVNGREFKTKADAERFDALNKAREKLETAQRHFEKLLAESATTADGYRFEFGVFCDYYHVVEPWNSLPYINKFCYLCGAWSVREDGETIEIREEQTNPENQRSNRYVPIKKLYRREEAANLALVAAREKWLAEQAKSLAEFRDRVKAGAR